jgi:hypothetical protein
MKTSRYLSADCKEFNLYAVGIIAIVKETSAVADRRPMARLVQFPGSSSFQEEIK